MSHKENRHERKLISPGYFKNWNLKQVKKRMIEYNVSHLFFCIFYFSKNFHLLFVVIKTEMRDMFSSPKNTNCMSQFSDLNLTSLLFNLRGLVDLYIICHLNYSV